MAELHSVDSLVHVNPTRLVTLGTSPLHLAAMNAHEETCRVLLRAGICRDTRTKVERTPLHLAAYEGHARVCSLLLAHGAQHDSRDMLQMTPLHWAVERGHRECARLLLEAGADPHATSKFLKTPLSLAAETGDQALLDMLQDALVNNIHKESELSAHTIQSAGPGRGREEAEQPMEVEVDPLLVTEGGEPVEEEVEAGAEALAHMLPPQEAEVNSASAALLRQHGITMLPTDNNNTLLAALKSGRTVVLSDAGKLLLKESEQKEVKKKPTVKIKSSAVIRPAPAPVTATPGFAKLVPAAPAPNKVARIFTINGNQLLSVPRVSAAAAGAGGGAGGVPRVRRITGNIVPLSETKLLNKDNKRLPLKSGGSTVLNLEQLRTLQQQGVLRLQSAADGRKILIHAGNLQLNKESIDTAAPTVKLLPMPAVSTGKTGGNGSEAGGGGGEGASVTRLRAELAAARAALAEREREVRSLKRRLLVYEPDADA